MNFILTTENGSTIEIDPKVIDGIDIEVEGKKYRIIIEEIS